MPDLPPLLKVRFAPGESVTDEHINRFNVFLARAEGESNAKYAQRLAAAGFARLITSEQVRDIGAYRQLSQEAQMQGIPVLVLTQEVTDPRLAEAKPIATLDDLIDRKTGQIRETQVNASGDAGADRNDPYHAATKAATKAGDPGHSAGEGNTVDA